MTREMLNWAKELAQFGYYTTAGCNSFRIIKHEYSSIENQYINWLDKQGQEGKFALLSLINLTEWWEMTTRQKDILNDLKKGLGKDAPTFYGEYLMEMYNKFPIVSPTKESVQWAKSHWDALYEYISQEFYGNNSRGVPDCVSGSFTVQTVNGRLFVSNALLKEWSILHPEYKVVKEKRWGYSSVIRGRKGWQLSLPSISPIIYDKWELGFPEAKQ